MSGEVRLAATARMRVTVEVPCGSHWGPEVTAEYLFRVASKESAEMLRNTIAKIGGRLVGEPVVTLVVVDQEAKP